MKSKLRPAHFLVIPLTLLAACGSNPPATSAPSPTQPTNATATVAISQPSATAPVTTPIPQPSASATLVPATGNKPIGLIAIGHSGLTGYNTDSTRPGRDAKQNSWATGTADGLNSVYQRLVAVRPEIAEHVANTAQGGAEAITLVDQARLALQTVPNPEIVLIQTIDNDIHCDGRDAENVKTFGHSVARALQVITEASPNSKIIMVSQPGRPKEFAAVIASNPASKDAFKGTGMCDLINPDGTLNQEHIATLTAILESFEAEQARVCAAVPQCSTDNGAFKTYVDSIDQLVPNDWNHVTVEGQARLAEIIWPVVVERLALK